VLVARRAAGQWGVLSFDQLLACGLSRGAVGARVRNGRLHRIHRGVYAVGHAGLRLQGRLLAALKACGPGAVLSHFSAAALFGLLDAEDRYPEVTVPGTTTRLHRGVRVHRTRVLDPPDRLAPRPGSRKLARIVPTPPTPSRRAASSRTLCSSSCWPAGWLGPT